MATDDSVLSRRGFLAAAGVIIATPVLWTIGRRRATAAMPEGPPPDVTIVEFTDGGERNGAMRVPKVVKSGAEGRRQLSPLAFETARERGTERPSSGACWNRHAEGPFRCVCCDFARFG